jgi:hypothetical protein
MKWQTIVNNEEFMTSQSMLVSSLTWDPRVWILNIPKRLLMGLFFLEDFDLELVKNNQKISILHIEIDQGAMYLSIVSLV